MGTDTKERILDVAEGLFADSGFATTSLRDITREADVNLASVNYHFGSKEALLIAVLNRRFVPVNERRLQLLDELEESSKDAPPEVEDILRAFLAPPFELHADWGAGGRRFIRLLGRIHAETNDEFRQSFIAQFQTVFSRFIAALHQALPEIDPEELICRTWFLVGSMAHTMMWGDSNMTNERRSLDEILESLIRFGAAGLSSPSQDTVPVRARKRGARS